MMIATDFLDKCENELWEEIFYLEEQQQMTHEQGHLYDRILKEIRTRNRRRQDLEDFLGG